MKKLMIIAAIAVAGFAFAQEAGVPPPPPAEAPAAISECAKEPEAAPKCPCGAEKKCGPKPECAGQKPGCERKGGEFRGPRHHGQHGMRHGMGGKPRFQKCNCCPECKGFIMLPPECGCGPKDAPEGKGCPCGKGPQCDCPKPGAPAPAPAPAAE